jgi:hypothetical protein
MTIRRLASASAAAATCALLASPAAAINSYNARPSDRAEVGTLTVQFWSDASGGWRTEIDWMTSGISHGAIAVAAMTSLRSTKSSSAMPSSRDLT